MNEAVDKKNWSIVGRYVEFCSCDHGCPCENMAPPTQGTCDGLVAFKIDKGHWENVSLDGLTVIALFYFPRAIHHGGGHMQPILDAHATEEQREALFYILGATNAPLGTMFQIFSMIIEKIHTPIFTDITFEWDIDARKARIDVPNAVRATAEPIRNPVTDTEHRSITVLPDGWVFHEAENASGFAKGMADIKFDWTQRHSSLAYIAWDQDGMTHDLPGARAKFPLKAA
jgi:hypothetical protein